MNHDNIHLILGPPGTGKTTRLLNVIDKEFSEKVYPHQLAFLSFTRKAAGEAKDRAMKKFNFKPDQLPWFRTIHSLAFFQLGLSQGNIMGKSDLEVLGRKAGLEFSQAGDEDSFMSMAEKGDKLLFLENLARITGRSLEETWERYSDYQDLPFYDLEQFSRTYNTFKHACGKIDFTDMLEMFIGRGTLPEIKVLVVDEAQDLSHLQWACVQRLAGKCGRVYIAGDDDQSIYRWAGADVEQFIDIGAKQEEVLTQSYRIPRKIHDLAASISSRIGNRKQKTFSPRNTEGKVSTVDHIDDLDLAKGNWLLLARHVYQLSEYESLCRENGWTYESRGRTLSQSATVKAIVTWENLRKGKLLPASEVAAALKYVRNANPLARKLERMPEDATISAADLNSQGVSTDRIWHESLNRISPAQTSFILAARRKGEKLLSPPRIRISTIHGAKGGEADNVVIMADISETAYNSMSRNMDDESRVFYVGCTRTLDTLTVVQPRSAYSYDLGV